MNAPDDPAVLAWRATRYGDVVRARVALEGGSDDPAAWSDADIVAGLELCVCADWLIVLARYMRDQAQAAGEDPAIEEVAA